MHIGHALVGLAQVGGRRGSARSLREPALCLYSFPSVVPGAREWLPAGDGTGGIVRHRADVVELDLDGSAQALCGLVLEIVEERRDVAVALCKRRGLQGSVSRLG